MEHRAADGRGPMAGPVIGLVGRWDPDRKEFAVPDDYFRAIEAAGGVPKPLALAGDSPAPVDACDGFVLCGSASDIDPARYGQPRHPQVKVVHPERDEADWRVLEHAFRTRKPVLGICFGMQSMNVFCGGTLVQHIPEQVRGALRHEGRDAEHAIALVQGARLAEWAAGRQELLVNSTHHQSPDRIGSGLRVAARAPDGVIEAVEGTFDSETPHHFVVGVEWHPERIRETEPLSARLFRELVLAAARGALNRNAAVPVAARPIVETVE